MKITGEIDFNEFEKHSDSEWLEKISKDLKGKSPDEIKHHKPLEGLDLEIFYSENNLPEKLAEVGKRGWNKRLEVLHSEMLKDISNGDLGRGVDAFSMPLSLLDNENELPHDFKWLVEGDVQALVKLNAKGDHIVLQADPIRDYLISGKWNTERQSDFNALKTLVEKGQTQVCVGGDLYGACGASAITELGAALAQMSEYLSWYSGTNLNSTPNFELRLSIGTDYFLEIAKFRAMQILVNQLTETYNLQNIRHNICGKVNTMSFAISDIYTNVIRATTACMSAINGGCDDLVIPGHQVRQKEYSAFAERITRNLQLLMIHEAHLNQVADPGAGSYYIENLTNELAKKAWKYFQEIESNGGLIKSFNDGSLQSRINAEANERIKRFREKSDILIGINKYRSGQENVSGANNRTVDSKTLTPIFLEDYL